MKRIGGRRGQPGRGAEEAPREEAKDTSKDLASQPILWQSMEGFAGWFPYMLSRHMDGTIYPVRPRRKRGRVTRTFGEVLSLSKLSGEIDTLALVQTSRVEGALSASFRAVRAKIYRSSLCAPKIAKVLQACRELRLEDSTIEGLLPEHLRTIHVLEVLGGSAEALLPQIPALLEGGRSFLRVDSRHILVFWDESRDRTLALRSIAAAAAVIKSVRCIRHLLLERIDVTGAVVAEIARNPLVSVSLRSCHILPSGMCDLVHGCRPTLKSLHVCDTLLTPDAVEFLRANRIHVEISRES